ncbi:hypothetical protein IFU37_014925 [Pantoea agglomerans]|uniref:Uncharacterized protein n=1 Tax=Enterobacter agglomerans TaxID=549 RepID=A0ACC5PV57_ENTAG|nr:hypothetical protein [Pantoea agglomerans]MBD8129161.1 hypothetical protein [Pantoea agglomerans]MBD8154863.1 hypothetical protein [Pantoea agglomerans]MBD8242522.1 hypothetical protein [Pantoea agglomerans]WVL84691.1 hypothetical protein IFU02_019815 [Pantoea agglomerans]WVL88900.1 hypothetical protein IFU37_014925 [Pantoea agglomerans]
MSDIYGHLVQMDFRGMDNETLGDLNNQCEDAHRAILAGIRAMGSLAFWAKTSKDYDDDTAAQDLHALGESLMCLPRIAEALNDTAQNAQYELWQRKGFPKNN